MNYPYWTYLDHDIYPSTKLDSPDCVVVTEGGYFVSEFFDIDHAKEFIYDFYEVPENDRDYD